MKKWSFVIDVAKCHDCNNCFLACKDEYFDNDYPPYSVAQPRHGHRWMDVLRKERGQYPKVDVGYLPYPCMHCDDAPCIEKTKGKAIYKREDGIVIIDPQKAKGKKEIVDTCPYGVIYWNEEKKVAQKCTFCVHLLEDGWKEPRCVQACPTGCLKVVHAEEAEIEKMKKAEGLEVWLPELQSNPRVYYKNLYRYTRAFIAGSVALGEKDECAEGAKVTLIHGATKKTEVAAANNYGDFKFDDLEENSGKYTLEIELPGYKKQTKVVELKTSINVGTISL
jgi:Fe-S-cluster-containing dehydrogenase component